MYYLLYECIEWPPLKILAWFFNIPNTIDVNYIICIVVWKNIIFASFFSYRCVFGAGSSTSSEVTVCANYIIFGLCEAKLKKKNYRVVNFKLYFDLY